MWGIKQDYFEGLLENNSKTKQANNKAHQVQKTVQLNIRKGQIEINEEHNSNDAQRITNIIQIDKTVHQKKNLIQKQMKNLDQEIIIHKQMLHRAKKQISHMRSASYDLDKSKQQMKLKQAAKLVGKWSKERQEIEKNRRMDIEKRDRLTRQIEMKLKKQQQAQNQFIKLQKKKIIELRIKQLEDRKGQRSKILINSLTHATLPKYVVAEKTFQQKEKEKKFEQQVTRKNNIMAMALNPQALKQHQKAYIERIKQRLNMKKSPKKQVQQNKEKVKAKSEFDLYLNRKDEKIKQQLQKMKRRQKFQQKISKMSIHVDQHKKIQRLIAIDKAKNPYKYNFLSQKALTDQQIYKQFPNFNVDIDPRKLGNQYLEKLKEQPRLRLSKSTALKRVKVQPQEKATYKNYLPEVKIKRGKKLDEIEQTKKMYKRNSKEAIQILNKKSQSYQNIALKKIKQLKSVNNYHQSINKQSEIDEIYMKSIKARIACLELN